MESLNHSFWGLIQTNQDDVDNEIQVETIKRILTSCSERPISKVTSLKAIQLAEDTNSRRRRINGCNLRSKSAPASPNPMTKKRKYLGKDENSSSPRKVHFADMIDIKVKETQVSDEIRSPETSVINVSNKPVPDNKCYEENKENIDFSTNNTEVSPSSAPLEGSVEQPDAGYDGDQDEENKHQARLRFQWSATKGLPAHILVVHLRVPFSQKLVTLKWQKDKKVFQSDKYDSVPVGKHDVTMIIAGREVQVEPLDVKFYTFEADVFLLEEDENKLYRDRHLLGQLKSGKSTERRDQVDRYSGKTSKTNTTDKPAYQRTAKVDAVNPQNPDPLSTGRTVDKVLGSANDNLDEKDRVANGTANENCNGVNESMPKGYRIPTFNKFSKTNKTKSSKMDESGSSEGVKSSNGIRRSKIYEKLVKQQLKHKEGQQRMGGSLENLDRDSYSKDSSFRDSDRDYDYRSSRAGSSESYKESQSKDVKGDDNSRYGTSSYRDNSHPRDSDHHRVSRSSGIESKDRDHQWSSRNGTESNASKLSRPGPHYYNSEQELNRYSDYGSHDSSSRRSGDVNMRRSNGHLEDIPSSSGNRLSKDKLHDGYRSLDRLSDLGWSGTEDKYEHDLNSSSRHRDSSHYSDRESKDHRTDYERRDNRENVDKYFSDSEVRPSRQMYSEDRSRTTGYDKDRDRYAQPQIRTPLVTTRALPLAAKTLDQRQERPQERHKEERVQDLEDTVMSLKQLLTDRDKEMELLQCEKRKLELDMRDKTGGAGQLVQGGVVLESQKETEKRINDLIREKENMATEIWQLKRDLDKAAKGQQIPRDDRDGGHEEGYDSTLGLHRKIEELESQLKDLQEVNETTAGNLVHKEKEVDQLKNENELLRKNRNRKILELEDDITRLKQQLERGGVPDDQYVRHEMDRLREDLRVLRDKNHQLVQDNIKLTEHLKDLEARLDIASSRGGSDSQGERGDLVAECQRYRKEREAALEEVEYLRKQLQKSRREGSLNRSVDSRDPYPSEVKLRSDDSVQTSMSQSVYRSHSTLVNGHGDSISKHERKHSGSDLSDSTAVLTTAHPGYHSDKEGFRKPAEKDTDSSHRYTEAHPPKSLRPSHNETIEDVLDEVPSSVPSKVHYRPRLSMIEDVMDTHETQSVDSQPAFPTTPNPNHTLKHNPELGPVKSNETVDNAKDTLVQDEISDDGQQGVDHVEASSKSNLKSDPLTPSKSVQNQSMLTKTNLKHFDTDKAKNLNHMTNSPFSVVSVSSSSSRQYQDSQQHSTKYSHSHGTSSSHGVATSNNPARVGSGAFKHSLHDESVVSSPGQSFPTYSSFQQTAIDETEETKPVNTSWTLDELSDLEDSVSCVGVNKQTLHVMQHQQQSSDLLRHSSNHNTNSIQSLPTKHYHGGEQTFDSGLRKRSNSVNSDCTDFLMSDVERLVQQYSGSSSSTNAHLISGTTEECLNTQHSMSLGNLASSSTQDTMHGATFQPIQLQTGKASDRLSPAPDHNSSLRSVSPKPLTTQHNKHLRSSPVTDEVSLMVANKRPFCPRNPADLHIDDIVKFSRQGGKISRGYVKYIGHLPGKHDTYLGVELEHEMGKHDGLYEGYRHFRCKPNKGVFVAFSKVVMAWGR